MDSTFMESAVKHRGCPACGGMLRYDMAEKKLRCLSCSGVFDLEIYEDQAGAAQQEMDVIEYHCPQCGAAVHTTQTNMVSYCSFCGAEVMFTQRMARTRRPDRIVPFGISREECETRYRKFMGKAVKPGQKLNFQPVYVPFYQYEEHFDGTAPAYYDETEQDRNYVYTHHYKMDVEGHVVVHGELECASAQLETEIANKLCFSAKEALPFTPAYLCGFYAEAPDLDANKEGSHLGPFAQKAYESRINTKMSRPIKKADLPPKTADETRLVLLPVWLLAQSSGDRVLYTAVNGENGAIVCDKPVQMKHFYWLSALWSVLVYLTVLLLGSSIILRANVVAGLCAMIASAGYFCVNTVLNHHAAQAQEGQTRRESRRCSVLSEENAVRYSYRETLLKGLGPLIPFGGLLVAVGFGLMSVSCTVSIVSQLASLFFMFSLVMGIKVTVDALKGYWKFRRHRVMRGTLPEWLVFCAGRVAAIAVTIFLLHTLVSNRNEAVAGLVSDTGWFPPMLCLSAFVTLLRHRLRHHREKADVRLYVIELVLTGLCTVLMFITHARWVYYGLSVVMMIPMILSMNRLSRRHNEFVTRPVPFFGREEAQE